MNAKKTVWCRGNPYQITDHERSKSKRIPQNVGCYQPAPKQSSTPAPSVTERHHQLAHQWATIAAKHPHFNPHGLGSMSPLSAKESIRNAQLRAHARRIAIWEAKTHRLFDLHPPTNGE
jgi:hypothetical protein